jgi:transcription termination factor NusB
MEIERKIETSKKDKREKSLHSVVCLLYFFLISLIDGVCENEKEIEKAIEKEMENDDISVSF